MTASLPKRRVNRAIKLTDAYIMSLPLARTVEAIRQYGNSIAYTIGDTDVRGLCIKVGLVTKVWQIGVRPPGAEKVSRKLGNYGEPFLGTDTKTGVEKTLVLNVANARVNATRTISFLRAGRDLTKERRQKNCKVQSDQRETLLWLLSRRVRGWRSEVVDTRETLVALLKDKSASLDAHTASDLRNMMRHLKDWLDLPLRELDWRKVAERFEKVSAEKNKFGNPKHTTANRLFRNLRGLMNSWLSLHPGEGLENPVNILRKSDKRANVTWHPDSKRDGWIATKDDGDEFVRWWRAVLAEKKDTIRDYLLLTVLQGAREGETAQLEWRHLNFDKGTIEYLKTKNKSDYKFPMTPYVRTMLEKRRDDDDRHERWVFPADRVRRLSDVLPHISVPPATAIGRVRTAAKLPDWQMHDLRRTFTNTLMILGVQADIRDYLMKHKLPGVKANYDKSDILAPQALLEYENYLLDLIRKADERDQDARTEQAKTE